MKRLSVYLSFAALGLVVPSLSTQSARAESALPVSTGPDSQDASTDPASGKTPQIERAKNAAEPLAPSKTVEPGHAPDSTSSAITRKSKAVQLNAGGAVRLNYGFKDWNVNPAKIDSASLLMREGSTGRTVQIYLEETAPDSSVFSGLYSINWQNLDKIAVEFYVPPQNLLQTNEGMKKILAMIASHELKRHPFILHRSTSGLNSASGAGQQTIDIFDTREQAINAMRAFRAEQQLVTQENQKYPSDSDLDTSISASDLREKRAAAHAQSERVRMEQLEAQRLQKMNDEAKKMSAAEAARRQQQAKAAAAMGVRLYQSGDYPEALAKFDQAVGDDPENHSYYFQYGVALYKSEQYNKSLVYLNLAQGNGVNSDERNYYIALNYFKLKEYKSSNDTFSKVVAAHHPDLSPSSEFYQGVIAVNEKQWDEAHARFQNVIDTSKDSVLDSRAEAYLDQIVRLQQFEKERSHKWQLSGTIGESFDSNILQSNNNVLDQGTASNSEGYRSLLMGSARYRPVYDERHEFAVQTDVLTMYSTNTKFAYSQVNRNADPTILSVSAPWTYKGLVQNHGYKFDLVPAYESDWMSIENNTQKQILSSYYVDFNNLLVVNEKWFANYNIEIRRDNSKLIASTGNDDSSAYKLRFILGSLFLINDAKTKIVTTDATYTSNAARGSNEVYDRWDASAGYIQPFYWKTTANVKLSYYYLNYAQSAPGRSDSDVTINLGATKPLGDLYNVGLLTGYTNNSSNLHADIYNRFTAMLTLSVLDAF